MGIRDRIVTADRLVVTLVRSVRDDEAAAHASERKLKRAAKRRSQRLAIASLATGPFAGVTKQIADLYSDTAIVCDLVAFHGLDLSDEQIAAHMLVLWSVADDLSEATAAIEGGDGGVMGLASRRLAGEYVPDRRSAPALVKAVWRLRNVRQLAPSASARDALMPGKPTRDLIRRAERQLGVT
jgi:hypothetical protein